MLNSEFHATFCTEYAQRESFGLLLVCGDASPAKTHTRSVEVKDKQTVGEGLTSCRQMTGVSVLHNFFSRCLLNRYERSVFGKRSRSK